ncbi:hypothetical protein SEA_GSHELBY23_6 [Microbacterium phage Gshelby23]|nr:hypothetical protein SEA_GSHELBY23_6 [Microbacterium phage Gshelby23]
MGAEDNTNTADLLAGRESVYGNRVDNMTRTAQMWNGYLGTDIITPADVAMMFSLYKAYRFKITPDYSDNVNDVLGYAEMAREVQDATGGLVHAETVKEYLEKKRAIDTQIIHDAQARWWAHDSDNRTDDQIMLEGPPEARFAMHARRRAEAAKNSLTAEQVQCENSNAGHDPRLDNPDECLICGAAGLLGRDKLELSEEEAEHRAAEEEIKEGRRPPHLRLRPENPEAVQEVVNMEAWLRNRCGKAIMGTDRRCRLHTNHSGVCEP